MTEKVLESLQNLLDSIVTAAPKVITAIVLFAVAVVVAKIIEKILRAILVRVRFDGLVARVGIDKTLQRIGLRQELNYFVPRLVYFLILILLAKTAADALGLAAVSDAFTAFFNYLPNIVAALLLVVLGTAAAQFAGQAVAQGAESAGIDFAPSLGRLVSAMILFIVGIMAIGQLKIEFEIIRIVTSLLLAGLALAFGLSFGLGTRDLTRNILAGFYARKVLRVGEPLEIRGEHGILKAITPTHTLIDDGGKTVSIANGVFLDEIARQDRAAGSDS